jgi:cytochrome P450
MMTFLGGPRTFHHPRLNNNNINAYTDACIGYRFSLVEMKALLYVLIRSFEFDLAVPVSDIRKKATLVQRPAVRSDPEGGNQLPLLVKPYII